MPNIKSSVTILVITLVVMLAWVPLAPPIDELVYSDSRLTLETNSYWHYSRVCREGLMLFEVHAYYPVNIFIFDGPQYSDFKERAYSGSLAEINEITDSFITTLVGDNQMIHFVVQNADNQCNTIEWLNVFYFGDKTSILQWYLSPHPFSWI